MLGAVRARLGWSTILTLAVGIAAAWLAFDNGTYDLVSRNTAAVAVWWAVLTCVAFGLTPVDRVRGVIGIVGLLAALALLTAASLLWAPSAEKAFDELNRVTLLLGVVVLVGLLATRSTVGAWADGLALAVGAIAVLALATRLFPGMVDDRGLAASLPTSTRLSYPLGYWNGLGIFLALGVPLVVRIAIGSRSAAARAAALGVLPVIGSAVYLTSSRGAVVTAVVAVATFLAFTGRRWEAAAAVVLGSAGTALAVAVLARRHALVNGPFDSSPAAQQGHEAAVLIGGIAILVALVAPLCAVAARARRRPGLGKALVAGAGLALVVMVAAANPADRFREFKRPPAQTASASDKTVSTHLLSSNGSGRWQFWHAAVDEWRANRVTGGGAGTYEAWWAENGSLPYFVRDAHSLYLESLGELGPAGFVLTIGLGAAGIVLAGGKARRARGSERVTAAALAGVAAGFAVAAGIDWIWELPVVSILALVAVALACRVGVDTGRRARPAAAEPGLRVAVIAVALVCVGAQAIPLLAHHEIGRSQDAVSRGDADEARDAALRARDIQPWASSPYLQLALVDERLGRLDAARSDIDEAIERDERDWRLWLTAARLNAKSGRVAEAKHALDRAIALNPRSSLFRGLEVSGR